MSRPADWTPLADADPVPGDPAEVALLGHRLELTAEQIRADVAYLRSLCTDEFWDSDAGRAFQGRVDSTASKLWQAHHRYLEAGEALGNNLNGQGYAAALHDAQSISVRALTRGQESWTMMRQALATVAIQNHGVVPFEGQAPALDPSRPVLDASGNPVPMARVSGAKPEVSAAVGRYNAHASDYSAALGLLRQAVSARDAAASSAAAKILAAIAADGLQDPTGLFADLAAAWDDATGWVSDNWARVVADIANVCGWLATGLGLLAMVFAFIPGLQPLAAILEGAALTLTEISLVCHLILAVTGNGPWMDVGLDLLSVATFGIGRAVLRGASATVKVADHLAQSGENARLGTLLAGLKPFASLDEVAARADNIAKEAISEASTSALRNLPGAFGQFGKDALKDIKPVNPATLWKTAASADWQATFADGLAKTLGKAAHQALRFSSPEITEAINEIREIPGLERVTQVTGIQFTTNAIYYGHLWTGTQIGGLTADVIDKIDSVVDYFGQQVPGYDWLKEHTKA